MRTNAEIGIKKQIRQVSSGAKRTMRIYKLEYSRTSLIRTPGTIKIRSSYPEFVLTEFVLTRFYCISITNVLMNSRVSIVRRLLKKEKSGAVV